MTRGQTEIDLNSTPMDENSEDQYEFPLWDESIAASMKDSLVLIGITYRYPDGTEKQKVQAFGIVQGADKRQGITIECHGQTWAGKSMTLPPDLRGWRTAASGEYRLKTTGEVITDPAYTCAFSLVSPKS